MKQLPTQGDKRKSGFSHYATLFICYLDEYVKRPETDAFISSLNIVTLHYESSRAQSVLSCQAFFIDENTLFMVKGSMENQFWASISFLLRKRNLPGNREDFAGPLTKMANDHARERSFNTRRVKIGYFTWSYNPHFIFTNALPPQLMNVIPSVIRAGKCLLSKGVKVLVWS